MIDLIILLLSLAGIGIGIVLGIRTNQVYAERMRWLHEIRDLNERDTVKSYHLASARLEHFEQAASFSRMVLTVWRRPSSFKPPFWS